MMKFEDIQRGRSYFIKYDDPNYPCDCPCHKDNSIIHFDACCNDNSYIGYAICVGKNHETSICYFIKQDHYLKLSREKICNYINWNIITQICVYPNNVFETKDDYKKAGVV